jgi:hypothetical protein
MEKINGWTVNERNGMWQMIYKGVVHYEHKVKAYVLARAKITRIPKG